MTPLVPFAERWIIKMKLLITGFGMLTPKSHQGETLWNQLINKDYLFEKVTTGSGEEMLVGTKPKYEQDNYNIEYKKFKYLDTQMIYSLIACKECVKASKLDNILENEHMLKKIGIISGSMFAQLEFGLEQVKKVATKNTIRISPYTGMAFYYGASVGEISCMLGSKGENCCVSSGSSIGADGIAIAKQMITNQRNKIFIVGAGENIVYDIFGYSLKNNTKVTSTEYIPYHMNRNGAAISNGAAMLCLEGEESALNRSAHVSAEIKAIVTLNASSCFFQVNETIIQCYIDIINRCLKDSGLTINDIGLVIPTAEGAKKEDYYELQALKKFFSNKKELIYTPKPIVGYCISFNVIIDLFTASQCIKENVIPGMAFEMCTGDRELDEMFVGTEIIRREIKNVLIIHKNWTDGKISGIVIGKYEKE